MSGSSGGFTTAGQDAAGQIGVALGLTGAGHDAASAAASGVSHNTAIWAVMGAGLVLVAVADFAPHLVNGLLLLILAGVVLKRSDVWIPWVEGVGNNFSTK